MTDEAATPAASGRDRDFRSLLAEARKALGQVEWVEQREFWTARAWFGDRDWAQIKVVRASLVTDAMAALAAMGDARRARLRGMDSAEAAVDGVMELLATDEAATLWPLIADVFFCAVTELHLPEWEEASDQKIVFPAAEAVAEVRTQFVRQLPVVLVARIVVACVVQAGNLLVRLSRG